jgi:molybdate transport system ATP-binding protein
MPPQFLISIEKADVSFAGDKALSQVSWRLNPGEHWAFIGPNGAGKTTFLRMIRGDIWPDPSETGRRIYALHGENQESLIGIKEAIALVSPEQQNDYVVKKWNMRGEDVVYSGFFDSIWPYTKPDKHQQGTAELIFDLLKLQHLRQKGILSMSQGEARKILIARALVSGPRILILDEFCNGLDIPSRKKLLHFADGLTQAGIQILYATHRAEELIPSLTHYIYLNKGKVVSMGPMDALPVPGLQGTPRRSTRVYSTAGAMSTLFPHIPPSSDTNDNLVHIENADVFLGSSKVLHNISWNVKTGENWAILGKNGSGKSTLIKIITGDIYPAWGGTVRLFGMPELVSLWDIRKMIGTVTPELQTDFTFDISVCAVVQSGFFSEIGLSHDLSAEQRGIAEQWLEFFGLEALSTKSVLQLSYGEKRKVLIARALVNNPRLLILDEPCNGLDDTARSNFLDLLTRISEMGINIIMITHHLDDLIPSITHALIIDEGRIVVKGKKELILNSKELDMLFRE